MAQHDNKRPSAARDGKRTVRTMAAKPSMAVSPRRKKPVAPAKLAQVETIESRLERKAVAADVRTAGTQSLGQISREQRHKLLYGD